MSTNELNAGFAAAAAPDAGFDVVAVSLHAAAKMTTVDRDAYASGLRDDRIVDDRCWIVQRRFLIKRAYRAASVQTVALRVRQFQVLWNRIGRMELIGDGGRRSIAREAGTTAMPASRFLIFNNKKSMVLQELGRFSPRRSPSLISFIRVICVPKNLEPALQNGP